MAARKAAGLIVLASLVVSTSAFGALGAHYLGTSRGQGEFRMYLDGGEFLGRTASFHSIRVAVLQIRPRHLPRTLGGAFIVSTRWTGARTGLSAPRTRPAP